MKYFFNKLNISIYDMVYLCLFFYLNNCSNMFHIFILKYKQMVKIFLCI